VAAHPAPVTPQENAHANPILIAQNLHKTFGELQAVRAVSFQIAEGEIFNLLGPNGAGKTTTIAMLTGLLAPTLEDARIAGYSLVRQTNQVKNRRFRYA